MFFAENPVLQRELLVNLRMPRAFIAMAVYVGLLGLIVFAAWPQQTRLDVTNPQAAIRLVNMFFLGQYLLAALMAPTFAAGAITGEKERRTYEMLLATPLRPWAIVLGKLLASLAHLGLVIFCSLPIVMLCLPLGGTSIYEVLAVYLAILLAVATFGMISLACSSFFRRTAASLVVSYLIILPLALAGGGFWYLFARWGPVRLLLSFTLIPAVALAVWIALGKIVATRLLYPPDVGSEGQDVVDEEQEMENAVGLVIRRDKFPDRLFAPPKRSDLIPDGANPVYDKEMRSELFSQGTLMMRVVIQASMFLAIPLMAFWLFIFPDRAPWYMSYVLVFNLLAGPVFAAPAVTNERERQTLDLLLTTLLTPWQILSGKLLAAWRVSTVLTAFLLWPVVLAVLLVDTFHNTQNLLVVLGFVALMLATSVFTSVVGLAASVLSPRTSVSLVGSYLVLALVFFGPLAALAFVQVFHPQWAESVQQGMFISPIGAVLQLPLDTGSTQLQENHSWWPLLWNSLFSLGASVTLLLGLGRLFAVRWRVAG